MCSYFSKLRRSTEGTQTCSPKAYNPSAYLPDVATTLNNLANLHSNKNELAEAEAEYAEALEIRRKLAAVNPSAYLPNVATTLINVAIYHLQSAPDREHSIKCAMEAVMILLPIVEAVPYTQKHLQTALSVLQSWGLSEEDIRGSLVKTRSLEFRECASQPKAHK